MGQQRNFSWDRFLESQHEILASKDTISRLPETVLQHVISFLPSPDKGQVRFLSRKWWRLHVQNKRVLSLSNIRINEQELSRILQDDFHSVEFLTLKNISGMRNPSLLNFKLRYVELSYCGSLKHLDLHTPNLDILHFRGPRLRPCIIEFGICKKLKIVHLVGVSMSNMMFTECNKNFPFLKELTLSGCDATGCIYISSNSLQGLSLLRFKNSVKIAIDGPGLFTFTFNGSIIPLFSNMNLPRLKNARIELNPNQYQEGDEIWFSNLIEMLKGLKHTERLEFWISSDKNIIIPKQLKETGFPPLDGLICAIKVTTKSRSSNVVDLVDAILWISPRVKDVFCYSGDWAFLLKLEHLQLSGTLNKSCSFCASHPSRCWRHSVIKYVLRHGVSKKEMVSYLQENLQKVGRKAIEGDSME